MKRRDMLERRGELEGRECLIIATDDTCAVPDSGQTVYEAAGVDANTASVKIIEAAKKIGIL